MFSVPDIENNTYGNAPSKTYNDINDAEDIRSIIKQNPKRLVEQLVLSQNLSKVRSALIVGPLIYGKGHGPVHTDSIQVPKMARSTLERGRGFRVSAGLSVWDNIHIHSLGNFFGRLFQAAMEGQEGCWNDEGVYAIEQGQLVGFVNC